MRYTVTRGLALGWLAVLVWGSLTPAQGVQGAYVFGDFVLHGFGYFGLTVLLVLSQSKPRIMASVLAAIIIGIALEGLQGITADRDPSLIDVVANATGALAGAAFCWGKRWIDSGVLPWDQSPTAR